MYNTTCLDDTILILQVPGVLLKTVMSPHTRSEAKLFSKDRTSIAHTDNATLHSVLGQEYTINIFYLHLDLVKAHVLCGLSLNFLSFFFFLSLFLWLTIIHCFCECSFGQTASALYFSVILILLNVCISCFLCVCNFYCKYLSSNMFHILASEIKNKNLYSKSALEVCTHIWWWTAPTVTH